MATIIQLNPIIPLVSPKGKCMAHFLLDYGEEHHLYWICFQDDTGECWTWSNREIKLQTNPTMGRPAKLDACKPQDQQKSNLCHTSQSSYNLPEPVLYSEELRHKIAEKFPISAFE